MLTHPAVPGPLGQIPGGGVAVEDEDRVASFGGDVGIPAGEGDRPRIAEPGGDRASFGRFADDAAVRRRDRGQLSRFRVPGEERDRVAGGREPVEGLAVGADLDRFDPRHLGEPFDAAGGRVADAPGRPRVLAEVARFGIAFEDRDSPGGPLRGDVDGLAVGADRDRRRFVEGVAFPAFARAAGADAAVGGGRLGQVAVAGVAIEDRHRVFFRGGDVDVLAVGADGDVAGTAEGASLAADVVVRRHREAAGGCRDRAQGAAAAVAGEGGDAVPGLIGDVGVLTVGAERDRARPDQAAAVLAFPRQPGLGHAPSRPRLLDEIVGGNRARSSHQGGNHHHGSDCTSR